MGYVKNSVHNQLDHQAARSRSGVQSAQFPGASSAQGKTQACIKAMTAVTACAAYVSDPAKMFSTAPQFTDFSSVTVVTVDGSKTCQQICEEGKLAVTDQGDNTIRRLSTELDNNADEDVLTGAAPGASGGIFSG